MKQYLNNLTTPSGRYCELREITNEEYKTILKYAQGNNLRAFFMCLDSFIEESINDFDEYDIIDKFYIYLSFCFYSIKPSIVIKNGVIGEQEITIPLILNNIEEDYKNISITHEIKGHKLKFLLPKKFIFEDENIIIDMLSGLYSLNDKELSPDEKESLLSTLPENEKIKMNEKNIDFFEIQSNIFKGVAFNSFEINLLTPYMLNVILDICSEDLESYYTKMYSATQYLKISIEAFYKLSPIELDILFAKFIKDKSENKERAANETINDSLGY